VEPVSWEAHFLAEEAKRQIKQRAFEDRVARDERAAANLFFGKRRCVWLGRHETISSGYDIMGYIKEPLECRKDRDRRHCEGPCSLYQTSFTLHNYLYDDIWGCLLAFMGVIGLICLLIVISS
jgi:hypothetical protein